jgi:uncharacterized protein (TIGR02996 family)
MGANHDLRKDIEELPASTIREVRKRMKANIPPMQAALDMKLPPHLVAHSLARRVGLKPKNPRQELFAHLVAKGWHPHLVRRALADKNNDDKRFKLARAYAKPPGITFEQADSLLGRRDSRKLATHTYLERLGPDTVGVRYHNTYVVKAHRDGRFETDSGGYRTKTTKERISEYAPDSVYQKQHQWHYSDGTPYTDEVFHPPGSPHLHPEAQPFIKAVNESGHDLLPRMVYADWLQEKGHEEEAHRLRTSTGPMKL